MGLRMLKSLKLHIDWISRNLYILLSVGSPIGAYAHLPMPRNPPGNSYLSSYIDGQLGGQKDRRYLYLSVVQQVLLLSLSLSALSHTHRPHCPNAGPGPRLLASLLSSQQGRLTHVRWIDGKPWYQSRGALSLILSQVSASTEIGRASCWERV